MKTLIVFYSLSGGTEYISNVLKKELEADIITLQPKFKLKNKGFLKYVIGGFQTISKAKPRLENYNFNVKDYDTIIIGSPVWAGNFVPAIRSFIAKEDLTAKKVAVFVCCHDRNSGKDALSKLKNKINCNNFIGDKVFTEPIKTEENAENAKKWTNKIG